MKHGYAKRGPYRPEYAAWYTMKNRCSSPTAQNWKQYGGRGITVCERWMSFENFLADMGSRPSGMTLDRIDNEKGYSPDNCRWASRKEQSVNRSTTRLLSFNGETMCVRDWAVRIGLSETAFRKRIAKMPLHIAITKPVVRQNHERQI